jgi:mevalonate pyrophosphate decarboxylase
MPNIDYQSPAFSSQPIATKRDQFHNSDTYKTKMSEQEKKELDQATSDADFDTLMQKMLQKYEPSTSKSTTATPAGTNTPPPVGSNAGT